MDSSEYLNAGLDLSRIKSVNQVLSHGPDMVGRCLPYQGETLVGHYGEDPAPVTLTSFSPNESPDGHAVDSLGEPVS